MQNIERSISNIIKNPNYRTIEKLDLSNQNLNDENIINLVTLIKANFPKLHTLILSNNRSITDLSVKELCSITTINTLDLTGNDIRDEGAIVIANNPNIMNVNLIYNRITRIGVRALGESKKHLVWVTDWGTSDRGYHTNYTFSDLLNKFNGLTILPFRADYDDACPFIDDSNLPRYNFLLNSLLTEQQLKIAQEEASASVLKWYNALEEFEQLVHQEENATDLTRYQKEVGLVVKYYETNTRQKRENDVTSSMLTNRPRPLISH